MKFINWPEWDHEELFDLTTDPLEQKNLVGEKAYAAKLAEMRKRFEALRTEVR